MAAPQKMVFGPYIRCVHSIESDVFDVQSPAIHRLEHFCVVCPRFNSYWPEDNKWTCSVLAVVHKSVSVQPRLLLKDGQQQPQFPGILLDNYGEQRRCTPSTRCSTTHAADHATHHSWYTCLAPGSHMSAA